VRTAASPALSEAEGAKPGDPAPAQAFDAELLQLRVFDLGFLQDGNIRIGILPESKEILVCSARAACVAGEGGAEGEEVSGIRSATSAALVVPGFVVVPGSAVPPDLSRSDRERNAANYAGSEAQY
jgi:hypothetical protein